MGVRPEALPGERTYTLSGADLHLPEGVTFLRAVPSQLRLSLSRRKVKEVPVRVRIGAPPPANFQVMSQEVSPAALRIAGPEGRVDTIQNVQTDPIDLSAITGYSEIRVSTSLGDSRVWVESSPVVTVRLDIEKIK